jgi:DNA-directed RNA polymerase subunit H (RpoH/RPB5)
MKKDNLKSKTIPNIKSMMNKRGIKLKEDFKENKMIFENNIIVLFYLDEKIKIDTIKELKENYMDYSHYILITNDKITSKALKELEILEQDFEIFNRKELNFNPSTHISQPYIKLLNEKEKKELCSKKLFSNKDNRYVLDDFIVRYFNAKVGDIFEIKDREQYTRYRLVTKIEK